MGWSNAKVAIYAKFQGWTACKVRYPGVPFQEPNAAYIAFNILDGEGREVTIGSPVRRRHSGVVHVQILDKENQGETTMLALADQLEPLFINANSQVMISSSEYLQFLQPYLTPGETTTGWQQRNLIVPFNRDDDK